MRIDKISPCNINKFKIDVLKFNSTMDRLTNKYSTPKKVTDFEFNPKLDGYAIKQPVFSFNKFPNVNKKLGPEMKSTGESILFIDSLKDDEFYDLYARRKMYLSK